MDSANTPHATACPALTQVGDDRRRIARKGRSDRYRNWLGIATLVACWSAESSLGGRLAEDGEAAALRPHARRESVRYEPVRHAAMTSRWRQAAIAAARRYSPVA